MDEVIRLVAERTGLSEEQSMEAVQTVVALLKQRLPEPASSMVDQALAQQGGEVGAGQEGGEAPGVAESIKRVFKR